MGNKRSKTKKPKQKVTKKNTGTDGSQMSTEGIGSPSPVRKPKKKK